jgi:hypothetical protein
MLSISVQDFTKKCYPDRELNRQQMAAIARWLRKQGFEIKKVYSREARHQIATIFYSETEPLPTTCPLKIDDRSPQISHPHIIAYVKALHALIEILHSELERLEKLTAEKSSTFLLPTPSPQVAKLLHKYGLDSSPELSDLPLPPELSDT